MMGEEKEGNCKVMKSYSRDRTNNGNEGKRSGRKREDGKRTDQEKKR